MELFMEIGFIPRKFDEYKEGKSDGFTDGFTIEQAELLEVSLVNHKRR